MRLANRLYITTIGATLLAIASIGVLAQSANGGRGEEVVLRGRVVCLDSAGGRLQRDACDNTRLFGFAAEDSTFFRFLASDVMTEMLTDSRVRRRELQLTARRHSNQDLEIVKIQAIKEGKLHDLYYFCQVCTITAYAPGPCPCCRTEMEFIESPVQEAERAGAQLGGNR